MRLSRKLTRPSQPFDTGTVNSQASSESQRPTDEEFLAELASLPPFRSRNARASSHPFRGAVSLPANGASQSNGRLVPVAWSAARPIPALNSIIVTNPIEYSRFLSRGETRSEIQQEAAKDDCGVDAFFRRIAAEISVINSPIGKGSMNVIAPLISGFLYSSLYLFIC